MQIYSKVVCVLQEGEKKMKEAQDEEERKQRQKESKENEDNKDDDEDEDVDEEDNSVPDAEVSLLLKNIENFFALNSDDDSIQL